MGPHVWTRVAVAAFSCLAVAVSEEFARCRSGVNRALSSADSCSLCATSDMMNPLVDITAIKGAVTTARSADSYTDLIFAPCGLPSEGARPYLPSGKVSECGGTGLDAMGCMCTADDYSCHATVRGKGSSTDWQTEYKGKQETVARDLVQTSLFC